MSETAEDLAKVEEEPVQPVRTPRKSKVKVEVKKELEEEKPDLAPLKPVKRVCFVK